MADHRQSAVFILKRYRGNGYETPPPSRAQGDKCCPMAGPEAGRLLRPETGHVLVAMICLSHFCGSGPWGVSIRHQEPPLKTRNWKAIYVSWHPSVGLWRWSGCASSAELADRWTAQRASLGRKLTVEGSMSSVTDASFDEFCELLRLIGFFRWKLHTGAVRFISSQVDAGADEVKRLPGGGWQAAVDQWSFFGPVLRALLQSGGATFYDEEGYFVKTPMVALVAVGVGIGEKA
eukprot:Skav235574  [mRNA]  locus=scaffold612:45433:50167:+ [translate_table: standard]